MGDLKFGPNDLEPTQKLKSYCFTVVSNDTQVHGCFDFSKEKDFMNTISWILLQWSTKDSTLDYQNDL
jgi:hypothetical protein